MNQPCRRQTAAGRFSGNLMTKVTVYFRTIRSGFNNFIQRLSVLLLIDIIYICIYVWASAGFTGGEAMVEEAISFNRRLIGSLLAVFPLAFHNRKLGYHSKWFGGLYSCFYPLQFAVLIVARYIIRGF